jgi:hypothetical protein
MGVEGLVHCINKRKKKRNKEKEDKKEKCEAYLGRTFRWEWKDEESPSTSEAGLGRCQ